jgi:hypothetical protein
MSSDLPATLSVQQSHARPIGGEELELLGKKAAAKYSSGKVPLTQAVVDTVKHAALSPEQVRRVAEFANISAYLTEFQKCGNDHRYVQFQGGPADVPAILRDLNDGGGGTVFDRGLADYHQPPPDIEKAAYANTIRMGDDKLAEAFAVEDRPLPYADPLRDAYDLYTKLADARDQTAYEISVSEGAYRELVDHLYDRVKQASLNEVPLGHVVQAWASVTDDPEFVKAAFMSLTPRLLTEQVFGSRDAVAESLQKIAANVVVDPAHELVGTFREYCETLAKLAALRIQRDELGEAHDYIGGFLLDALDKTAAGDMMGGATDALVRGASSLRRGWQGATGAAAAAAPAAQRVGEALGGPLAGRLLGGAVKYAPHIGAGLLAEEGYQRARYSPAFQASKNFALSRIPYTHPYLVRQYDLQMQGMM